MMDMAHYHKWEPGYEELLCDCGMVLTLEDLAPIVTMLDGFDTDVLRVVANDAKRVSAPPPEVLARVRTNWFRRLKKQIDSAKQPMQPRLEPTAEEAV